MRVPARVLGGLLLAGLLYASDVVSFRRDKNVVRFVLSDGAGEVEWITSSTFRLSRRWDKSPGPGARGGGAVNLTVTDLGTGFRMRSQYLVADIAKSGARLRVKTISGTPLLAEAAEARREADGILLDQSLGTREKVYGLGPEALANLNRRGSRVETSTPFLISSEGYGVRHLVPAKYTFDVGRAVPDRCQVAAHGANRVDYYFYYGPTPKEIYEQHQMVMEPVADVDEEVFRILPAGRVPKYATKLGWNGLEDGIRKLCNSALSGILVPAVDLGALIMGSDSLYDRAAELAAAAPVVFETRSPMAGAKAEARRAAEASRRRLTPYLVTYLAEARDRGIPMLRPLPLQYPSDPRGEEFGDQFMLGDEILAAPASTGDGQRSVYLPMGIWTDLQNNRTYKGRQVIEIAARGLPLFAKNGSIIPFLEGDGQPMSLHYFPRLGAEFFLYETDSGDISQFHAAPALDFTRLEIESDKDRSYEWVVHHSEPVTKVERGEKALRQVNERGGLREDTWWYDAAARNLHVRVEGPAGADVIVNLFY